MFNSENGSAKRGHFFGNNIAVDPTFKCHAERSRIFLLSELKPSLFELFKRAFEKSQIVSIYLKRGLRSNAFGDAANAHCEIKTSFISLAQSQHSHTFRMTFDGNK